MDPDTAFQLGVAAFHDGIVRRPMADPNIAPALTDPDGPSDAFRAWTRGWDTANLDNPVT